jgi:hypothetical protein
MEPAESSATATIRGYVKFRYKGILLPVTRAEIIVASGLSRTFTDDTGYYEISDLPPGWYYGTVRKSGYHTERLFNGGHRELTSGPPIYVEDRLLSFSDGRGPSIRGYVLGPAMEIVEGAEITVLTAPTVNAKTGERVVLSSEAEISDPGGFFQMSGIPGGERMVRVALSDGRVFTNAVTISGNMTLVISIADHYQTSFEWREAHFPNDAVNSIDERDPDGDSWNNWQEFVSLSDPNDPNSFWLPEFSNLNHRAWQFTVPVTSTDRLYTVQWSTNLLLGAWTNSGISSPGNGADLMLSFSNAPSVPKAYYRLGVQLMDLD